jgi:hypothetical protein
MFQRRVKHSDDMTTKLVRFMMRKLQLAYGAEQSQFMGSLKIFEIGDEKGSNGDCG